METVRITVEVCGMISRIQKPFLTYTEHVYRQHRCGVIGEHAQHECMYCGKEWSNK